MRQAAAQSEVIQQLQQEILSLQGYRNTLSSQRLNSGLGPVERAFPGYTFPIGAMHELLSIAPEEAAATSGFITGLLSSLMRQGGTCLWVSTQRKIFPPALKVFGIAPDRVIFIDVHTTKHALWAIEEALKCEALAAVVGELSELSFTESRRLQLAVEESHVTGFLHRYQPKTESTIACMARWRIKPLASNTEDSLPGVGFPRWNVQLLKVRNGRPGAWQLEWAAGSFRHLLQQPVLTAAKPVLKTA